MKNRGTTRKSRMIVCMLLIATIIFGSMQIVYAANDNENLVSPKSGGSKTLEVKRVRQDAETWCGPACGYMVLKYLGKTVTQSGLARDMGTSPDPQTGTYVYMVVNVLNQKLGITAYNYKSVKETAFYTEVIKSIDAGKPVICQVQTRTLPNYAGHVSGHYITVYGYTWGQGSGGGQSIVRYHDPNYNDPYYGSFSCDANEMITAIDNNHDYYISAI